jgi:hypothetical protein
LSVEPWWEEIIGSALSQGDLLRDCVVPVIPADFKPPPGDYGGPYEFDGDIFDVIVVTQRCDLEQNKAPLVATCPVSSLAMYESSHPEYSTGNRWERVRQGRVEGLHLLAALRDQSNNHEALVVDFRQIYSLPVGYLTNRASDIGPRFRLRSPYLEHFSQAFARFFMRVGLPSDIPRFS